MKIYIASSWKNQHAVEMLTKLLRERGHEVLSFVENNHGEGHGATKPINFEDWMKTPKAYQSFLYDTEGAMKSDCTVYISPSGKDAAAEVGAAFGANKKIFGLYAKGEDFGLMRMMVSVWHDNFVELLDELDVYAQNFDSALAK